ncbi:hypothetical protein F5Y16DRAFT_314300 [Xylariaceae sp. FL0255]|nr:hypothetical protein F5Y16DRAFT_314300 [Xylariaceae sp. FL0255]
MHLPTTTTILTPLLFSIAPGTAYSIPSRPLPASLSSLSWRDTAPASLPHISSISYSGTGCPVTNPQVIRTGAGYGDMGFELSGFQATLQAADPTTSTSNCEVHINSAGGCTAGWQAGIKGVTVAGHLVLDPGAEMDWYLSVFWSADASDTSTISGTIVNNGSTRLDEDISVTGTTGDIVWSPCAAADGALGILNADFVVALNAPGSQYAFFGKDADTTADETWDVVWRQC